MNWQNKTKRWFKWAKFKIEWFNYTIRFGPNLRSVFDATRPSFNWHKQRMYKDPWWMP